MREFRFQLERLRWYRTIQEALAEQGLAIALREAARVETALATTRQQADREAAALRGALAGALSGTALPLHVRYAAALTQRIGRLERERGECGRIVAERREGLQERRRAAEAVEQLRQHALIRHRRAAEREEQSLLDECGGSAAARRIQTDTE
jgi:flagellar export protein FliJ